MKKIVKRFSVLLATLLTSTVCLAGAWGPGSFENDDALDWATLCTASKGSAAIASALNVAVNPGNLDAADGAAAVAAAELVAATNGKPDSALPKELVDWLNHQSRQEIAKLAPDAKRALVRVKDARSSELAQLWDGSVDKHWIEAIANLELRLH